MQIKFNGYTKIMGSDKVIDNVNLTMESGNVYGFKGQNGSGKTMLMRAICGLILPTDGNVTIDDKIVGKDISFPESVGLLLENPSFINGYSGFKNLKMIVSIRKKINDSQIADAMQKVGLDPKDKRHYRKYSLGMKQKLGIACAIMEEPDLIILDEPFNGLDEAGILRVKDIVHESKESGALVILTCHDNEELYEMSDEIYLLEGGRIRGHEIP